MIRRATDLTSKPHAAFVPLSSHAAGGGRRVSTRGPVRSREEMLQAVDRAMTLTSLATARHRGKAGGVGPQAVPPAVINCQTGIERARSPARGHGSGRRGRRDNPSVRKVEPESEEDRAIRMHRQEQKQDAGRDDGEEATVSIG